MIFQKNSNLGVFVSIMYQWFPDKFPTLVFLFITYQWFTNKFPTLAYLFMICQWYTNDLPIKVQYTNDIPILVCLNDDIPMIYHLGIFGFFPIIDGNIDSGLFILKLYGHIKTNRLQTQKPCEIYSAIEPWEMVL